jgi:hypothetical protein
VSDETRIVVLYHAQCPDGWGAAVAAWHKLGDTAGYCPVRYGDPLPKIADGARVYIVDFSYDRQTLLALAERCEVTVLDHHKTAQAELEGLPFATFDLTKSGAVLAWEHFCGTPVPPLLLYIQDRDLWQWQLLRSREVSAGLALEPHDFKLWAGLINMGKSTIERLATTGSIILAYQARIIAALCDQCQMAVIDGHCVPVVNSATLGSEIGHELLERHHDARFVAIYFDDKRLKRVWSLRSRAEVDVSAIARRFGGGGHPQAAGFEQSLQPIRLSAVQPAF